ncbi:MAG: heterocyst frequency control protein PatD [Okeania sp. SIO2G4]|uniref:heterocyst frequency control protein PatD n=1 Tax=unclassified Okeania TaxID=2634635 RepID=UPI0013B78906|nr:MULTISPECIES: heterocyst frequency control protein PatD [unclassified Okeania]NEP08133.1 heterocyst frequency control protein PatD [Okeania sp. SIO4D6]NEP45673.1 heterocyst frequency control protein PatD [Okeania sp. SIO2H7]NEP71296.1 heterocyst frequency control protein PatD [Okeania sp. SIO2G5]NEP92010.1 heterocyst frequency control protein PatD [Okeania sp. SIO2F5]NEQ89487.1 heterocyst frequency control protein PatD [Okeania sp. SIO2G4]
MLPKEHNQRYQTFSQLLNQLQELMAQENLELEKISAMRKEIQQFFEIKIMSLDNLELDLSIVFQIKSYLTEIHKELRLLYVDLIFLQASRNPQTTQKRLATIKDRLKTLIGYCGNILSQTKLTQD